MDGNRQKILKRLSNVLLAGIRDKGIVKAILALFNIIEQDAETIRKLKEEVQKFRDEVNLLKGEQGKPDIQPGKSKDQPEDDEGSEEKNKDIKLGSFHQMTLMTQGSSLHRVAMELKLRHNKTPAAVLAIITLPARTGTRANASLSFRRQAAEPDIMRLNAAIYNCDKKLA